MNGFKVEGGENPATNFRIDWTEKEVRELIGLVKEYGRDFKVITQKLGTRTRARVVKKAQILL